MICNTIHNNILVMEIWKNVRIEKYGFYQNISK